MKILRLVHILTLAALALVSPSVALPADNLDLRQTQAAPQCPSQADNGFFTCCECAAFIGADAFACFVEAVALGGPNPVTSGICIETIEVWGEYVFTVCTECFFPGVIRAKAKRDLNAARSAQQNIPPKECFPPCTAPNCHFGPPQPGDQGYVDPQTAAGNEAQLQAIKNGQNVAKPPPPGTPNPSDPSNIS